MRDTRWSSFRRQLGGAHATYGSLFALTVGGAVTAVRHDLVGGMGVALAIMLALMLATWRDATREATNELFSSLAPRLGLTYMVSGSIPPVTPLLAAGSSRTYAHFMEGPIFGALGGPRCGLAHYTFSTHEDWDHDGGRWPFTVCGMEITAARPLFHGVYVRPRGGVVHDWLDRAPRPEPVELESTDFTERYELRATPDQDPFVLRELFAPSFQAWLAEHPLRPGFECKGGVLVVYIAGHELDPDRLTLLHDASRGVARRVCAAVTTPRPLGTSAWPLSRAG